MAAPMTIEECVYWLAVADWYANEPAIAACVARDDGELRELSRAALSHARYVLSPWWQDGANRTSDKAREYATQYMVSSALMRAAIRAIVAEREAMAAMGDDEPTKARKRHDRYVDWLVSENMRLKRELAALKKVSGT